MWPPVMCSRSAPSAVVFGGSDQSVAAINPAISPIAALST
jgi:hypothetical protein